MTNETHNKKVENIRISLDKQFKKQMRLLTAKDLLLLSDYNLSGALNALLKAYGFINRQLEDKIAAVYTAPAKQKEPVAKMQFTWQTEPEQDKQPEPVGVFKNFAECLQDLENITAKVKAATEAAK